MKAHLSLLIILTILMTGVVGATSETPTDNVLICTIYFYTGDNIGDRTLTTGPHQSADGGLTWNHMAWDTLITSAIDVDSQGKTVCCACGNGVLASTDGGRNWRVSGGWRMAEIQDVAIGPESPLVIWAAGSYGLFLSEDGAKTWTRPGEPQPFRYVDTVCLDRGDPDRVFIGTEDGLYVTADRGAGYRHVGPDSPIRSILQDSRDEKALWIGTDGEGLWKSNDSGDTWDRVDGTGDVVNRVIQNPQHPEWIYCGMLKGVAFSPDGGAAWRESVEGFGDFAPVYALLVDSSDPEKIYAGSRDGFYVSDDNAATWRHLLDDQGNEVFHDAVIFDLWQGELYRGPEEPPSGEWDYLAINSFAPPGGEFREDCAPGFDERADAVASVLAASTEKSLADLKEGQHVDSFSAIALIREGRATDALWDDLRARYSDFGHSMFDSFPAISFYLNCQDQLPDDLKELIREGLIENNVYRGDTENHWLMYYTTVLLSAQTWPATPASEWYTGMTAQENYDDALGWINEWTRITTTIGQGEFDSPHYYNTYMAPCLLLYEFAKDPALKRKIGMIIDLLLADMAAESLQGRYCGGHSRMYDPTVVMGDHDPASGHFYLYFGGIDLPADYHSWGVNGVYSSYRCPRAIADIALTRDEPYIHTEVKRVRNQMRYSELLNSPVYKYTFMTPDFCLGSLQGGILQPIQQHTWDVTWIGSAPNTTLFSLHPYYAAYELAMFFPEDPHMLTASVQAQKSTYTNPQKLCSSSPFERTFQVDDTLLAVYNIPEGTTHELVALYVPDCLQTLSADGWIFGHDGNTYIAIYPCSEGEWVDEPNEGFPPAHRLQIPAGQTAFAVEIGRPATDGAFDEFMGAVIALQKPDLIQSPDGPVVNYTDRHGDRLSFIWSGERRLLNGQDWIFQSDRLFDGPFVQAAVNERIITIRGLSDIRTLDFNRLTITQVPIGQE